MNTFIIYLDTRIRTYGCYEEKKEDSTSGKGNKDER